MSMQSSDNTTQTVFYLQKDEPVVENNQIGIELDVIWQIICRASLSLMPL